MATRIEACKLSHRAMATVFEITILHEDFSYAGQAAQAAFDELDIIEQELSRFRESSDISRINNMKAHEKLKLGPHAFECLKLGSQLHNDTEGAFDCTLGQLADLWSNKDNSSAAPSLERLVDARRQTGMNLIELEPDELTVTLKSTPMRLDLGGIGKGYAIDRMAELLNEWSIDAALIHGGRSAVYAIGAPESTAGWEMSMSDPDRPERTVAALSLRDRAMSASGLQKGPHIINPFTARPVDSTIATWVLSDTSAIGDALSTAFMVMPQDAVEQYCLEHPDLSAMIMVKNFQRNPDGNNVFFFGQWN